MYKEFDASSDTETLPEIPSTADNNENITNRNFESNQLLNGNITDQSVCSRFLVVSFFKNIFYLQEIQLPRISNVYGSVNGSNIGQHDNDEHGYSGTLKSIEIRLRKIEEKSGRNAAISLLRKLLQTAAQWESKLE